MRVKNSEFRKSKNFPKIASETFKDFAENTSIHGLKYLVKEDVTPCEKAFWGLVIISGLCGAVYMTILFWERYTSNLSRTTYYTTFAPTTAIPFPAVTICNLNPIMTSKVEIFMKNLKFDDTEEESIIRKAIPQLLSFTDITFQYNLTELTILQDVLEQNNYTMAVVMEEISQNCSDMFIHCRWNTRKISCLENFHMSFSHGGACCSFNFLKSQQYPSLYTEYSGLGTGLNIFLNPQVEEVRYSHTYPSGFKVIIHYPTEYPGATSDSRIVTVGNILDLQVFGTKLICSENVKSLSILQRKCLYPDEYPLKYFGNKYSDFNCLLECEEKLYFELCGCVPFYFSFSDKPMCNISKIPCLQYLKTSHILHTELEECICMTQCEDSFYQPVSTSTTMKYTSSFSTMWFRNSSDLYHYSLLNVFFLSNTQTILMRDTITSTISLLSSFGGVYSLFMGCSLITIAEIIYYGFFRFLINWISTDVRDKGKCKRRGKHINVNDKYERGYVQHIYGHNTFIH